MRLALLLPVIAACGVDEPPAPIVVTPAPAEAEWSAQVQAAVDEWVSWCPGALVVDADDVAAHEVRLVPTAGWYGTAGALGELVVNAPPWYIMIRGGRLPERMHPTLLHEFAHVLIGRYHVGGILSEGTVAGQRLTAEDAARACP